MVCRCLSVSTRLASDSATAREIAASAAAFIEARVSSRSALPADWLNRR